jgi:hypothetical protein
MFSTKALLLKFFIFIGVYLALTFLFKVPALQNTLANVYSFGAAKFLDGTLWDGFFQVSPIVDKNEIEQGLIKVVYGNEAKVNEQISQARFLGQKKTDLVLREFKVKFEEFFLFMVVFFIALLSVTPISVRQKLKNAVIGLLLIFLFSWFKLRLHTLYHFSEVPLGVYEAKGFSLQLLTAIYNNFNIGAGFLFVTLIWGVLCFSGKNWKEMLTKFY